jgi:imidazolonepropionase-like amidohydrolase
VGGGYLAAAEAIAAGEVPEMDDPNGCIDPWTRDKIGAIPELSSDLISEQALERRRQRVAERNQVGDANLMTLSEAGIPIAMGTDAGNVLTAHGPSVYAEMEAMQAAGMTPAEVLISATSTAARAMLRDDIGTLEMGMIADLLVLGSDPLEDIANIRSLEMVMRGGVMRSVQELAAAASTQTDID